MNMNSNMPEHVGQTRQSKCFNYMSGSETDMRHIPKMTRRDMALENGHEALDWEAQDSWALLLLVSMKPLSRPLKLLCASIYLST